MALPDFEAWAIFATVADERSFSGAAAVLGLSKATISKAVSRLESAIGTTLFHRTSRRLALTDSGTALAERARAVLAEGLLAESCAREDAAAPAGLVRLAAPMSFGVTHLGPVIARFLAAYPGIDVELSLDDARIDLVGGGFDAALRIAALEDSTLRARKLCDVALELVASPIWLDRRGAPGHPRDLRPGDVFDYRNARDRTSLTLERDGQQAVIRLGGRLRANNADVMLASLVAGEGIALLPDFIGTDARKSGVLVRVLPEWHVAPIALYLVTPPGRLRPRRVEALLNFLSSEIGNRLND